MLEKMAELQTKNPDHLVFNNFIETQTILKLLTDKGIITPNEFKAEKIEIIKSMIEEGITNGLFSDRTCELFKNQLDRLNKMNNIGA